MRARISKVIDLFVSRNLLPQWVYDKIHNYSISRKIRFIIKISSLPVLVILLVIFVFLFIQLSGEVDRAMHQKKVAVSNSYKFLEHQTQVFAHMIADNAIIQKELLAKTVNAGPLLAVTRQAQQSVKLNDIIIHDKDGNVISHSDNSIEFGKNDLDILEIKKALLKGEASTYISKKNNILELSSSVPIIFAKEIVGVVTVAYKLNHKFAKQIYNMTQANIFFITDKHILSTSLGELNMAKAKTGYSYSEKNENESLVREVKFWQNGKSISMVEYDFRYLPITTNIQSNKTHRVGILVVLDQSSSRLNLLMLLIVSLLLTGAVITSAVFLALKIGRNITDFTDTVRHAMKKFQSGDLSARVKVTTSDELGEIAGGFNNMATDLQQKIKQIEEARDTLELKVIERTKDLKGALDQVTNLKELQEGDYMLNTLLVNPLGFFDVDSKYLSVDFFIEQKKKFNYKGRNGEIGGDVCYAASIKFKKSSTKYLFFFNGDAMGKSSLGASGTMISGVIVQSFINRYLGSTKEISILPEKWLVKLYYELHNIFKLFDGYTYMSCACGLVNEEDGELLYFNAEHPLSIIYRKGKIVTLENEITMYKLGMSLQTEPAKLIKTKLLSGDILIAGSDGREDLEINGRISSDDKIFHRAVMKSDGSLRKIVANIKRTGHLIDDLSLLSVKYNK